MLEFILRCLLVYLSFVQPVIYGAQLCHSQEPDAQQVTNVTLTLIFAWLLEVVDVVFLSSFIAMRWLYLCARIILALYFSHHRFLGAVQVYQRLFSSLVDAYFPVIDTVFVHHVQSICNSGLIQYGAQLCMGLLRGIVTAAGIAKMLMDVPSTTAEPVAPLLHGTSQERGDGEIEDARIYPPLRQPPTTRSVPLELPSLFYDASDERQWPTQRTVN
ncbi:hypothetical protein, conserved [Leishmania tarentolae]|uniref:Uncharacterized protein n=1 Tax=Leishmania tarentolae TaxID=5689 RepID=A0A640L1T7_LEITA|nr:hypothetical protein, conserved [Leishmania tarentolae]